jgi:beta-1,4-N-acetylglucosaminyltransferase
MIFVTVGTTQFDKLVKEVDRIAPGLNEEVVMQIGESKHIPRNCTYFTYDNDLSKYFIKADVVVAHGGAGSTFEVLGMGKKLISIENPNTLEGHQGDLLGKLSSEGYLIWCKDLNKIEKCIKDIKDMELRRYEMPECTIGNIIKNWLECHLLL